MGAWDGANRLLGGLHVSPASALKESLRDGYGARAFGADALAGVSVGLVALPLSMALAIASGVAPQHGLYTAIVAGAIVALLGGAKFSVTGPTAAFVVILAPVSAKFGVGGLMLASVMAGVILLAMSFAGVGALIKFIPYPVTTGFTTGIAVVIASLQIKDFFGIGLAVAPEHFLDRLVALGRAVGTVQWQDFAIGAFTLSSLVLWPRVTKKVPAPLVAIAVASVVAYALSQFVPAAHVHTIGDRFQYDLMGRTGSGIPRAPPLFAAPWNMPGGDGAPIGFSFELLQSLLGPAFAIALLGAIESLLCAVVADGMTGSRHNPDTELFALGIGNLAAPFFGGFAATGAMARTAANIRAGARSPLASVVHSAFLLVAMLALAPLLSYLPMASLAALLLLVAWNMSDRKHFAHILRVAPRSDVLVLLACCGLTIVFDMVVGVCAGVVLAALLFMRRMVEVTDTRIIAEGHPTYPKNVPKDVLFYEIRGALFFGAAEKAMAALQATGRTWRAVIFNLEDVPVLDVTGLVALEEIIDRLRHAGSRVFLANLNGQPLRTLTKAGWKDDRETLIFCEDIEEALFVLRGGGLILEDAAS